MDPERKIGARSAVFLSEAKESLSNTSPTLWRHAGSKLEIRGKCEGNVVCVCMRSTTQEG
jgi:hypothetical protein